MVSLIGLKGEKQSTLYVTLLRISSCLVNGDKNMNYLKICLLIAIFTSCKQSGEQYPKSVFIGKYNIESAQKVIAIARSLQNDVEINENDWNELFRSKGYQNYLIYSDSIYKKDIIKDAIITVFNENHQEKLDSLLSIPIKLDQDFFKLSILRNFYGLKQNLTFAESILETTDFSKILESADSIARRFLPAKEFEEYPDLFNVYFINSDPDGMVTDNAIVIDLNNAIELGVNDLTKMIAHEYHHNYRKIKAVEYHHPLMRELNKIHQEGLADLIDKQIPPLFKMGQYPQSIIQFYNMDFENTPQNLRHLDSLTLNFIQGTLDSLSYEKKVTNYFKFGGHPSGLYMALLIDQNLGRNSLIDTFADPVQFISLYNQVASVKEAEHVLSVQFVKFISEQKILATTIKN